MSRIGDFAAYAAAFEKAYQSNRWEEVARHFTDDAVYEVELDPPMGGRFVGRQAIVDYFRWVLDAFDRRFASRELALVDGPSDKDGSVWLRGSATYRAAGVPDLVLVLELVLDFEGERIRRMVDRYEPEMKRQLAEYVAEHGAQLGIPL